jgi:hypothetical protein
LKALTINERNINKKQITLQATAVWQNGGISAKFNIWFSKEV